MVSEGKAGRPHLEVFEVEGFDQINQGLPSHHLLYLGQKLLAFGLIFGDALLAITKTQVFAAHQPALARDHGYSHARFGLVSRVSW